MHLPRRDVIATALVAVAGVLYLLWAVDSSPPGLSGTRATGLAVLALGFAASASAVVPSFDQLVHGNRGYLVVTSVLGLVALVAGVQVLVAASEAGLGVVMATMVVLWAISTVHHVLLARQAEPAPRPSQRTLRHGPPPAAAH